MPEQKEPESLCEGGVVLETPSPPESTLPAEKVQTCDRNQASRKDCVHEIGGPKGPEPTRFGDWERSGRCIDF